MFRLFYSVISVAFLVSCGADTESSNSNNSFRQNPRQGDIVAPVQQPVQQPVPLKTSNCSERTS